MRKEYHRCDVLDYSESVALRNYCFVELHFLIFVVKITQWCYISIKKVRDIMRCKKNRSLH